MRARRFLRLAVSTLASAGVGLANNPSQRKSGVTARLVGLTASTASDYRVSFYSLRGSRTRLWLLVEASLLRACRSEPAPRRL